MGLQGVGKCSLFILLCAEALLLRLNQRVEAHDLSDIVQIGFARARFSAFVRRIGAARCELAVGNGIFLRLHIRQRHVVIRPLVADTRHSAHQKLSVRVCRLVHDLLGRAVLNEAAAVQRCNVIGYIVRRGKVMGDVDKGDLVLILQLLEQVDDVHFHGSIDSRNRFVGNDQLRTGDKRTCNGNTLQLAAGELGGVFALYDRQREADALQGVIYKVCSFCFVFRNAKAQRRVEQVRVYLNTF